MPDTINNKVDDPCQECRDRHLKCDDSRPRCRQCERLGEKCHRSGGRLKFRHGSSAKYDQAFGKDQTWLSQSRNAKIQFVDQGPELENFYSHDDGDILETAPRDDARDGSETAGHHSLRRSQTASTVHTSLSPETRSSVERHPNHPGLAILSPTSTLDSNNPRSPLKRAFPDESSGPGAQKRVDHWSSTLYDPIRFSYRVYEPQKTQNPYDPDPPTFATESTHLPKIVEAEYRRLADTAAAAIPPEVLLTPAIWKEQFYWPNQFTTTQCACLMRYFIEKLAPWFDVGDPERTFALVVPQRARRCPPLLNAIFTAAARHLTLLPEYKAPDGVIRYQRIRLPDLHAQTFLRYHEACIAYLKVLSHDPIDVQDENLLAAAVILRFYEELDSSLENAESEGFLATFNLVFKAHANPNDSTAPFTPVQTTDLWSPRSNANPHHSRRPPREVALNHLQGFRHACFRIALRQETATAFMKQQPVHLPLSSSWSLLDVFEDDAPDSVWADRHLQHCSEVLQFCFGDASSTNDRPSASTSLSSNPPSLCNITKPSTHKNSVDRWHAHKSYQDHWEKNKPLSFSPIHFEEPSPSPNHHSVSTSASSPFPQIWYMAETHAIGMQYLDLARILLTVYNPSIPRLGPGATAAQKRVSADVREIVLRLCGIAEGCPECEPARMQAYMAVAVCGERFEEEGQRNALLEVLVGLERGFGWPTRRTREELRAAWGWY